MTYEIRKSMTKMLVEPTSPRRGKALQAQQLNYSAPGWAGATGPPNPPSPFYYATPANANMRKPATQARCLAHARRVDKTRRRPRRGAAERSRHSN